MTKVTIKQVKGSIVAVECDGHTHYGAKGEDVVCAALSSVVQTAVLGLMQVLGLNVKLVRNEKRGYLKLELPDMGDELRDKADVILNTMLLGISDLHEGFSDFIELIIS